MGAVKLAQVALACKNSSLTPQTNWQVSGNLTGMGFPVRKKKNTTHCHMSSVRAIYVGETQDVPTNEIYNCVFISKTCLSWNLKANLK